MLFSLVMIWRHTWEQLAETIIGNELLAVFCDMQFNSSDGSSSLLLRPVLPTSAWGELQGWRARPEKSSYDSWQEPTRESISCRKWTILLFEAVLYLALGLYLHGWHGSKVHLKLLEGSGRRAYEAMKACTLTDEQGFLPSSLTSFRYIHIAERPSPF